MLVSEAPESVETKSGGYAKTLKDGNSYKPHQLLTVTNFPGCSSEDAERLMRDELTAVGVEATVIDVRYAASGERAARLGFDNSVDADTAKLALKLAAQEVTHVAERSRIFQGRQHQTVQFSALDLGTLII
jgi:hypothetical protein